MVELYWQQTLPFPAAGGRASHILRQNPGQAEIVRRLEDARALNGASLPWLRANTGGGDQVGARGARALRTL
jgi:hypothetical protein